MQKTRIRTVTVDRLYERLAARIAEQIERGTLRPGERVPSVRRMMRDAGTSLSTVLSAYDLLENKGLIEARPQSGYYVSPRARGVLAAPAVSTPRRQPTRVDVSELVFNVFDATKNPGLVPLGSPFPAPELFPLPALNRTLAAVARHADPAAILADLPPGNPELRRRIAQRYLESSCRVSADEIVITNGAMEALNLCLQAVARPGDAIAVESPTFYGVLQAIENMGMKAVEVATHPQEGIDLAQLAAIVQRHPIKACFLMTSFQNPLGGLMPEEKKRELVTLLERHNLPLIEDDVYGELHFGLRRPKPAKAFERKGLVLHCASFSKTLAPGYRVGWTAAGRFQQQVERLKFMRSISTATLPQAALAAYLSQRNIDRHLRRMRLTLAQQASEMADLVGRHFPRGTRMTQPQGGYMLWIEMPESVDALELFRLALEQHISIAPGPMFSAKRGFRNCVRLNYGQLITARTRRALQTVGELAKTLC